MPDELICETIGLDFSDPREYFILILYKESKLNQSSIGWLENPSIIGIIAWGIMFNLFHRIL